MIQHVSETVFVHLRLIETECPDQYMLGFFAYKGVALNCSCNVSAES